MLGSGRSTRPQPVSGRAPSPLASFEICDAFDVAPPGSAGIQQCVQPGQAMGRSEAPVYQRPPLCRQRAIDSVRRACCTMKRRGGLIEISNRHCRFGCKIAAKLAGWGERQAGACGMKSTSPRQAMACACAPPPTTWVLGGVSAAGRADGDFIAVAGVVCQNPPSARRRWVESMLREEMALRGDGRLR